MSLPSRLLGANPSIQVSTLLSGSLTTPSAKGAFIGTSFESIQTYIVSSTQQSITFTSIPQTYAHLQLRCFSRDNRPSTNINNLHMELNEDTGANFDMHSIRATGTSILSTSDVGQSGGINVTLEPGSTAASNVFAVTIYDIYDYTNTNKFKQVKSLGGYDLNGVGYVVYQGGGYRSTNAISSIKLYSSATASFTQYSKFALYGIKGS